MSDEGLRQVLARHGYRLRYREHDWVECLLASSTETFRGEGLDPAAALQDALSKAFPSRISRTWRCCARPSARPPRAP